MKGHVFDLRELENQFKVGAVRVMVRDGSYYLRARALDEVPQDAISAARERAADVVRHVNGVMALVVPGFHDVAVDGLRFVSEDPAVRREPEGTSSRA